MDEIPRKETFPSKKQCNVREQPATTQSKTDPHTQECSSASAPPHNFPRVAEDALSNSVVLRNIFTMLNQRDLESCSNVSQCWRTVADPLVPSYFDIELVSQPVREYSRETGVIYLLKEKTRFRCYSLKRFTRYELDFKKAREKLTNAVLTHKVSINLTFGDRSEPQDDTLNSFLSEFGAFVVALDFKLLNFIHTQTLYQFWLQRLPNLKKLDCSNLSLEQDSDEKFDPDLLQFKLLKLSKISGIKDLEFPSFSTLVKMAPNLKEISNVWIEQVDIIAAGGWGSLLKSLHMTEVDDYDVEDNVKNIFETLAELEPKLTSFTVPSEAMILTLYSDDEESYLRSLMFAILQSSSQSLKSLGLQPAIESKIQALPPLMELNTLEFHNRPFWDPTIFFFRSMEISLEEMFPNVREVCIWFCLSDETINHYFPENIIIPWGSRIRVLKLDRVVDSSLLLLQKRFPSVQKLQISVENEFIAVILSQLAKSWPQLSSLVIDVWYGYVAKRYGCVLNMEGVPPVILDSAFTGLPEETVNKLLDPTLRKNFPEAEIQGFKDGSPISQLKELKELKLIFGYQEVVGETVRKLTVLTQVANEFGFQLLPQLMVTLKIRTLFIDKEVTAAVQPLLAESNNIQFY